jgi:hypothetical protein
MWSSKARLGKRKGLFQYSQDKRIWKHKDTNFVSLCFRDNRRHSGRRFPVVAPGFTSPGSALSWSCRLAPRLHWWCFNSRRSLC